MIDVYSVYFDSNGGSEVTSGTVKGGKIANSIRNVVQASAYINELGHVHVNIDTK